MNYVVATYTLYFVISAGLTIWVARTLHKSGRIFLIDAFHGNEPLADSINHLLVVGFYLINIGYVSLALSVEQNVISLRQAMELVSDKVGVVLLVLGLMHFFNLFIFSRIRKRSRAGANPNVVMTHAMPQAQQL